MVFQSYALFPHMSVIENVSYGLKMINVNKEEYIEKALETLKLVNLDGYENRMPSELSGGQQQRVAVARAIVLKPKVLLFDEPLSNLDAKLRRQVREDIREIQQKLGVTTIYVTHDQEEALAISDKVIVMNKAVIAQQGSPKDLYNFPKNKFVANFIGDANDVSAEIINKQSNTYELKLAEMSVNIESNQDLNDKVTLALRPEKIKIERNNDNNCIHATIKNASFVGSSYQYILNSKIGKLYVISGDTNNPFKVGEEVFLSLDEKDVKVLND
jgi:iron(III) transport system ATP-binding protein